MKYLLSLLLLVSLQASADTFTAFDATDKALGAAALSLELVDLGQTLAISDSCHTDHRYYETNSILGACPETHRVYQYFVATVLIASGVAYALPDAYRKAFLTGDIVLESFVVIHNYKMGIGFKF